jgi:hypothetical protein
VAAASQTARTPLTASSGGRAWTLPAIVLAALGGANVVRVLSLPPADGDLGWQHWLGVRILAGGLPHALGAESFTAAGARWVPQEWLFSMLWAVATGHGLSWFFALMIGACAALALGCVALRCARSGAHPAATALVLVLVDVAMSQSFGVRVQVVGWLMLALFLLAFELPGRLRWTAILVAALWANWHASAMLAPVLAAAAAAGSAAQGDARAAARDLLLALACGVAVCATPFGTALPVYALELAQSPIRHWIREWRPTALSDSAALFGALPILVFAAFAAPRSSRRAVAIALPFTYLALTAVRNVPLIAIACAPLAAIGLTALLPSLAALRSTLPRGLAAAGVLLAFLGGGGTASLAARGTTDERPLLAIAQLARSPGAHRLFCEDFAWCGLALETGRIGVFVDGRADPFPRSVWASYDTILHTRRGWPALVRRYAVDAMLVRRESGLDRAARRAGWRIARDGPIRLLAIPHPASTT